MERVRRLSVECLLSPGLLAMNSASVAAGQGAASDIARRASGSFVFTDHHPITVWFCRPPSLSADSRIVFVMHGSESRTARQACDIAASELPEQAISLGVPLRWQLQIVHDVEHAPVPMVRAALQLLR